MTLQTFIRDKCGNDINKFLTLVHDTTGERIEYALVWRWIRGDKARVISYPYARLIERATSGVITVDELQDRKTLTKSHAPLPGPRQAARVLPPKARKSKAKRKPARAARKRARTRAAA